MTDNIFYPGGFDLSFGFLFLSISHTFTLPPIVISNFFSQWILNTLTLHLLNMSVLVALLYFVYVHV